jgi:hypothetical protein
MSYLHKYTAGGKTLYLVSDKASKPSGTFTVTQKNWDGRAVGSYTNTILDRLPELKWTKKEKEEETPAEKEKKMARVSKVVTSFLEKVSADPELDSREALFGLGKPDLKKFEQDVAKVIQKAGGTVVSSNVDPNKGGKIQYSGIKNPSALQAEVQKFIPGSTDKQDVILKFPPAGGGEGIIEITVQLSRAPEEC